MTASHNPAERRIAVGSNTITYTVSRSMRKATRLMVDPTGRIEVRTSDSRSDKSIERFVQSHARWIFKQQDYFATFRPRDSVRRYAAGETIRYLGRQYRIKMERSHDRSAKLRGRHLVIRTLQDDGEDLRRQLARDWLRDRAVELLPKRVALCLDRASPHGISEPPISVRWMTRRWGSCSPRGRLILNPLLVITPIDCVDYVVMHELCHLKYPTHDSSFYRLLDRTMPDWRPRRERLEQNGRHISL